MIKSIENFRKIEAPSVAKNNNRRMYLLRGGPLDKIDEQDMQVLRDHYNVKTIIDFRSKEEVETTINKEVDAINYYNIDILDPHKSVAKNPMDFLKEYEFDHDLNFMEILYTEFVLNEYSKKQYREFLKVVSESQGSVYFHCTAGKDRTGFAAMLLLEILGADKEDIFSDYLKTNEMTKLDYKYNLNDLQRLYDNEIDDELLKDLIGVREEYLNTSLNLINQNYDGVIGFIRNGLNVSEKTLDKIRTKFQV